MLFCHTLRVCVDDVVSCACYACDIVTFVVVAVGCSVRSHVTICVYYVVADDVNR